MSTFDSTLKGKYYVDANNNGVYDVGEDHVDEYGNIVDANGVSTYVKGTAGPIRPRTKAAASFSQLFDYGSEASFLAKVDNSLAGQMRDCAECHVGGGAMEYIPVAPGTDLSVLGSRQALRSWDDTGSGVNAFNYFIDQYDEDGDGVLGEVLHQDYSQTGVLEMDCLMCHLEGYSWEERKNAIRKGNFDASRAAGAGIGTVLDGTNVAYNLNVEAGYSIDGEGGLLLTTEMKSRIKGTPPSENCSSCHFDMHQVDWKKRGSTWGGSYENEVHTSLGCMGCHSEGIPKDVNTYNGQVAPASWTGAADASLGHDPAKGAAPYSSLWNNTDNTIKTCKACHIDQVAGNFGAVDPTPKHAALGLTSIIMQDGRDGVRDASHLDIIDCAACHTRKLGHGPTPTDPHNQSLYEWGTGGAMVDSTGPDTEGRVTDHENLYVERTMEDNMAYSWQGNKLIPANALITMFWRDKDEDFVNGGAAGYVDVNADGQTGGMDAVNPSHLRNAMAAAGLEALTADGVIDAAEIQAQRAALTAYLPTVGINLDPDGDSTPNAKLKLSFMGVMFKANHNTSPASYAWGKGGCLDCHGVDRGFYNGPYVLKGRDLNISYATTDSVPFTKVNMNDYNGDGVFNQKEDYQFSDFHPTLFAKGQPGRTIALTVRNGNGGTTLRTIDKSELLWENDLTPNQAGTGTVLYDGSITGTQGGVYETRVDYVNYLNTRVNAVHNRHVAAGYGLCTTCHDDGAGNIDFNSISDVGAGGETFTYAPDALGNPGTCSTNTCHGNNGFSTTNSWELVSEIKVVPYLSALSSQDTDLVVTLDASRSNCDGASGCSFSFDNGGGTVIGGNGTDQVVVQYPAEGDYTAVVTVTDIDSGQSRAASAVAHAITVEKPVASADFATLVSDKTVTLTAPTMDASVVRAYVYWGDRTRTVVTNIADLQTGVNHAYARGGRSYNVRVTLIDAAHNMTDYTFAEDADLTVTIP